MCGERGWYSAKYDSTKQCKVVREPGGGMLKYTTSIRFEILLTDTLVVTDAQWYDGSFFAEMAVNKEEQFEQFVEFAARGIQDGVTPFLVRRRENFMSRFQNPFLFSSIRDLELRNFIYNIWQGTGDNERKEVCASLKKYLDFIAKKLKCQGRDSLQGEFKNFRKGIEKLDDVDERLFVPWGEEEYIPNEIKAVRGKLERLLDKYTENETREDIVRIQSEIKEELGKDYPNRSKLLNEIELLEGKLGIEKLKINFMSIFDDAYNYAIARQHGCKYYDLYDALSPQEYNPNSGNGFIITEGEFPQEILAYLGAISWNEFGDLYYDQDVACKRRKWLDAFDSQNEESAKEALYQYLDSIVKKTKDLGIWLVENSVFYRPSGTKRFVCVDMNDTGQMVAGAGGEQMIGSDSIHFFFAGDVSRAGKNTIIRYGSTDKVNNSLDTVIAPIEKEIERREKAREADKE